MAGHSKWANIKFRKAAQDARRGKLFTKLIREITVSARSGGGDVASNSRLRAAVDKALAANMPRDTIDRAVKRGTGELDGVDYEEIRYEGYGPGGVGIIVEVTTDNKNRSASEVRSYFTRHGGNLAGAGALAYNFQRKGQFLVSADKTDEDTLMEIAIEASAEDVINNDDHFEIQCEVQEFDKVSQALAEKNIQPDSAELVYLPGNLVPVAETGVVRQVLKLIEVLDDLDDEKAVHANYDIDDSLLTSAEG